MVVSRAAQAGQGLFYLSGELKLKTLKIIIIPDLLYLNFPLVFNQ